MRKYEYPISLQIQAVHKLQLSSRFVLRRRLELGGHVDNNNNSGHTRHSCQLYATFQPGSQPLAARPHRQKEHRQQKHIVKRRVWTAEGLSQQQQYRTHVWLRSAQHRLGRLECSERGRKGARRSCAGSEPPNAAAAWGRQDTHHCVSSAVDALSMALNEQ